MTSVRDKLIQALILGSGIVASIAAYVDTGKAWVTLCILVVTVALEEGLERFRRTQGKATE